MGATIEDLTTPSQWSDISSEDSPHVPNAIHSRQVPSRPIEDENAALPNSANGSPANQRLTTRDELIGTGMQVMGTTPEGGAYVEYSTRDLVHNMRKEGRNSFNLMVYKDDFSYTSSNGAFESTYRYDGYADAGYKKSDPAYIVRLGSQHYLFRNYVDMTIGANLGVGYNGGYGFFVRNGNSAPEQSQAKFRLWTFPADLSLGVELPLLRLLTIGAYGGPSMIGLLETRNDLEDGNARKNMRQLSYGYFAALRASLSLSWISPESSYDMYSSYSVTRYYLSVEGRVQNYSSFGQSDLEIDGSSIGFGLTFDYL